MNFFRTNKALRMHQNYSGSPTLTTPEQTACQCLGSVPRIVTVLSLAPQSGAHRRGAFRDFQPNPIPSTPLTAFEHLSLYIQKHLSQSVAVCGSLWWGRSWQTKAEPGTARAEKTHNVLCLWKAGPSTTWRPLFPSVGVSNVASNCLQHCVTFLYSIYTDFVSKQ